MIHLNRDHLISRKCHAGERYSQRLMDWEEIGRKFERIVPKQERVQMMISSGKLLSEKCNYDSQLESVERYYRMFGGRFICLIIQL